MIRAIYSGTIYVFNTYREYDETFEEFELDGKWLAFYEECDQEEYYRQKQKEAEPDIK